MRGSLLLVILAIFVALTSYTTMTHPQLVVRAVSGGCCVLVVALFTYLGGRFDGERKRKR